MQTISNVIDIPKHPEAKDQLGINNYKDGLVNFIKSAQTPLTIAIQGEWGSGKTSLMNSIQHSLCDKDPTFYGIWVNTWEYALLTDERDTMTNIIRGILAKVIKVLEENNIKDIDRLKRKATSFLTNVSKVALKAGANLATAGMGGEIIDELFNSNNSNEVSVKDLHQELQKYINICVEKSDQKTGFLFFIDDLDRVNPPMAVHILELLKNIFDLENCIFILAIDYDIVVKGLEPKFGKKTDDNEREFRSFFEKIIQLPFSMPVGSYNIKDIIIDNLLELGYFTKQELDEEFQEEIQEISLLTVGKNPRAIKRLLNALSLIKCINQSVESEAETSKIEGLVNYAVFSIQVAYPLVYKALVEFPDYINWGNEFRATFRLNTEISQEQKAFFTDNDLFDEPWEQALFQYCQKDSYLKNRVARISKLLNKLKKVIVSSNLDLETIMTNAFEIASVTSIDSAADQQVEAVHKSSFLKQFRSKFINPFKEILEKNDFKVEITQKRIQSNLMLNIYKEGKKLNTLYISLVSNKKDYRINFRYDFWYYAKADIQPFEKALLSNDLKYSGLKAKYDSGLSEIEKLTLPVNFEIWNGISINEGHYTTKHHLNYFTSSPKQDLKSQEILRNITEIVADFTLCFKDYK